MLSLPGVCMRNQQQNHDLRMERIAHIRCQIAAGTYETPEKLARALDVFLECQQAGGRPARQEEK
jgi:anti-sigma28 factor (negative regulator of flagellin synthesis)